MTGRGAKARFRGGTETGIFAALRWREVVWTRRIGVAHALKELFVAATSSGRVIVVWRWTACARRVQGRRGDGTARPGLAGSLRRGRTSDLGSGWRSGGRPICRWVGTCCCELVVSLRTRLSLAYLFAVLRRSPAVVLFLHIQSLSIATFGTVALHE